MTVLIFRPFLALALAAALGAAAPAGAHELQRENEISFSASADLEVTKDLLTITLAALREGGDAATVQTQLKQALDAALAEAKKAAQPKALEVRTGNFALYPRHGKDGRITGWQGQAELVLEGRDMPRVAQLAGRLAGMNITQVSQSVSRELADKHEAEVTAQAIQAYRAKATELAKQFGYTGYVLRQVSVQTSGAAPSPRAMMLGKAEAAMAADAALPVEAGKSLLSATVSGTVQLAR